MNYNRLNYKFIQHCPICFELMEEEEDFYLIRSNEHERVCKRHQIKIVMIPPRQHSLTNNPLKDASLWIKPSHPAVSYVSVWYSQTQVVWANDELPRKIIRPLTSLQELNKVLHWVDSQLLFF